MYYARYGVSENLAPAQKKIRIKHCQRGFPRILAFINRGPYLLNAILFTRRSAVAPSAPVAGTVTSRRFFPGTRWTHTRARRASPRISRANIIYEYVEPAGNNVHGGDHNLGWKMVPHPWGGRSGEIARPRPRDEAGTKTAGVLRQWIQVLSGVARRGAA